MLKFTNYIKESNNDPIYKYKKGDVVIFHLNEKRPNKPTKTVIDHDGKTGVVEYAYPNRKDGAFVYVSGENSYSVAIGNAGVVSGKDKIVYIVAYESELTLAPKYVKLNLKNQMNSNPSSANNVEAAKTEQTDNKIDHSADYIENQFNNDKNTPIPNGSRVSVEGKQGRITFTGQKGKVVRLGANDEYLIEFDDDDSNNRSSYTALIGKELITLLDEPLNIPPYGEGDTVKCIDKKSTYFDDHGVITKYWDEDKTCMVKFDNVNMWMKPDQIVLSNGPQTPTQRKIGFKIPDNVSKTTSNTPVVYEEEDEDDTVGGSNSGPNAAPFKKEDLIEFSYKDFLLEEKISNLDSLLILKSKYEKELSTPEIPKLKKLYVEKSIKIIEIIESYYQFLTNKVAKDLPVYRTVEQIENIDLLKTKTKVRASDSKELTRKYSFDQGIIAYWRFKDALIFKTI